MESNTDRIKYEITRIEKEISNNYLKMHHIRDFLINCEIDVETRMSYFCELCRYVTNLRDNNIYYKKQLLDEKTKLRKFEVIDKVDQMIDKIKNTKKTG